MSVETTLKLVERQIRGLGKKLDDKDEADVELLNCFGRLLNSYCRMVELAGQSKANGAGPDDSPLVSPETGYRRGMMRGVKYDS